jgi:hypothetical protein
MRSPAPPPPALEYAEECTRAVRHATGLSLDGTPETLPILDHYLRHAGDLPRAPTDDPVRGLVVTLLGAYFGEVVRRSMECRWAVPGPDSGEWRIEFSRCLLTFFPVAIAWEILLRREIPGRISEFLLEEVDRDAIADRLAGLPGAATRDYFTFTMRYETLELIGGWLMESSRGSRRILAAQEKALTPGRYRTFLESIRTRG